MLRYHVLVCLVLHWVILVAAVVVLVVRRPRAPRAVGLALPVVAVLALLAADMPANMTVRLQTPMWLRIALNWVLMVAHVAFWVLLPVAAMMDRRREDRRD